MRERPEGAMLEAAAIEAWQLFVRAKQGTVQTEFRVRVEYEEAGKALTLYLFRQEYDRLFAANCTLSVDAVDPIGDKRTFNEILRRMWQRLYDEFVPPSPPSH